MATLSHSESRRLYSWWWDSHISPKNSKWLQQNLTEMDAKVKTMIKLIEEDADSFAKRAEMYYKKRPELMKLVEEFYRAYRALAERYDHATGALRLALADDSPPDSSVSEVGPHTPERRQPTRATVDPDELHKDALGLSSPRFQSIKRNAAYSSGLTGQKGLKQFNEMFDSREGEPHHVKFAEERMGKGLHYDEEDRNDFNHEVHVKPGNQSQKIVKDKEASFQNSISNHNLKSQMKSSPEVQTQKDSLAKLEAEKKDGHLRYQHALERLSNLEAEVVRAQEDAREFNERASKAEDEVQILNEALTKLQTEKEEGLLRYQHCVEGKSNLENKISPVKEDAESNSEAMKGETQAQSLQHALAKLESEKEAILLQYNLCLQNMSELETKISLAQENARKLNERAVRAETEVQHLKETIAKLSEEKEAASLQYQRSLETINALEGEVFHAQEEATRLSSVIVMEVARLNSTEEQYLQLQRENQSLQSEVETLLEIMTIQKQELSERHEELERLNTRIENICSMDAEAALKTLQNLHSECPEDWGSEVHNGDSRFKIKGMEYQGSEEEVAWGGSRVPNEENFSSATVEKNLQNEMSGWRDHEVEPDEEVEAPVEQTNVLRREISSLKEERNDFKRRNIDIIEEMKLVGLDPDCLGSSVKSLREENLRLKDICQKDSEVKASLSEKLKTVENLLEKNAHLESSLSDVNAGLELLRMREKALEDSCQNYVTEQESLILRLEKANNCVEKLSEKNTYLKNILIDAEVERGWLREKSRSLEEFCQSLDNEKLDLVTANGNLFSQFTIVQQKMDGLGRSCADLEENHSALKKDMESKTHKVEELQATLNLFKQEHASFVQSSQTQLAHVEGNNNILQEEGKRMRKDLEDEQDNLVRAQLEIFILQKCIQEMEESNVSLFAECQKQFKTSNLSELLVTNLERENFEQRVKVNSMSEQVQNLRLGVYQMATFLKVISADQYQVESEEDQTILQMAMRKIEDMESTLWSIQDEKHQLLCEKTVLLTLLGQLGLEAANIESEKNTLDRDLKNSTENLLLLQSEWNILKTTSEHLNHQIGTVNKILNQKEMELSEAEQKLNATEISTMDLYSKLEDKNRECDKARLEREALIEQNLNISESITQKTNEIELLQDVTGKLELEINRLHEEANRQRVTEDCLISELQYNSDELKLWQYEADTLYCNCQVANIHAGLLKEKVHELSEVCERLGGERDSKLEDIEQLRERFHVLESDNEGVKSELAAYFPVILSLRDSVRLLEDHLVRPAAENLETEDNAMKEQIENQSLLMTNGVSDLLELQTRIKRIESSMAEQKRLAMQNKIEANTKLDAAMEEIKILEQAGHENSSRQLRTNEPEFSEVEDEMLVKDIPLDQVSHSSSYDHGSMPHALRRPDTAEKNDEILELWETEEHDFDLDLTFKQQQKLGASAIQEPGDFHQTKPLDEKSEWYSSELPTEEWRSLSNGSMVHQEGGKKKILERLASDAQKLMNLQLSVQDLNKKVEQLEKYKKPKDTELNTIKEQLKEVEEAIMRLIGTNGKLSKKAETNDGNEIVALEEKGKATRDRISERARRASEKIGRLQVEAQRIQFVLMRLEDKYKNRGKDRKVLLKDYLYGNTGSPSTMKRKKRLLFTCVNPSTKSD